MQFSSQIRAARALLGWSQSRLARTAGIGLATLQRVEQSEGIVKGNFATVLKIQKALEHAGISFSDEGGEIGVRLLKEKALRRSTPLARAAHVAVVAKRQHCCAAYVG